MKTMFRYIAFPLLGLALWTGAGALPSSGSNGGVASARRKTLRWALVGGSLLLAIGLGAVLWWTLLRT